MAGHRGHDQHFRLWTGGRVFERTRKMQEPAERSLPHRNDVDRDSLAANEGRGNAPFGLAITTRRSFKQFRGCRKRFAEGRMRQRINRVLEEQARGIGERARRIERRVNSSRKASTWGRKERRSLPRAPSAHHQIHQSASTSLRRALFALQHTEGIWAMGQRKSTLLTHHPTRRKYVR